MIAKKSFTKQENLVAECLSEMGFRYDQQVLFERKEDKISYIVDFFISEINTVIEADGIYGHFRKADKKRDEELLSLGVEKIIHIKSQEKEDIKKELENYFGN